MKQDKSKTMTLKKKFFENIIINKVFYNNDCDMLSVVCEKIADDYAIEFAYWYLNLFHTDNDSTFDNNTQKELLEIFKKEKGL